MRLGALAQEFRQFRLGTATRLSCSRIVQRLADRLAIPSYSQTGEDRIIAALLPVPTGFYVDVGSNDPVRYSNTFALYRRGWRGIVVDANPALIRRHRAVRPRDVAVHAVVSETSRSAVFTEFDDPLVSSLDASHVETWSTQRRVVQRHAVTTEPLTAILDRHGAPPAFEVLSVDVEGHDREVVASLDLRRYRPRLIVVEMHAFSLERTAQHPVVAHLAGHGYDLVAYAVANGYFLERA